MPRFVPKRYEQILKQMIAKVVSRTGLSDISDSSALKHVLAAAARQDDEQYYQMQNLRTLFSLDRASGSDLDARAADYNPLVIARRQATRASGTVVFTRAGNTGTTSIPIGTTVKTADGIRFQTTAVGTITPTSVEQITGNGVGRDSAPVAVLANEPGAAGNVVSNTITAFENRPNAIAAVTNLAPTTNGADQESDSAFRSRIRALVQSLARSPASAIEGALRNRRDPSTNSVIQTVNVIEDQATPALFTVYVDDGFGTATQTEEVTGEVVTLGLGGGGGGNAATGGEIRLRLKNIAIDDTQAITITSSTRGALTRNTHYTLNPRDGSLKFAPALASGESITADYTRYTGIIEFAQRLVTGDRNDRQNYPGLEAAGTFGRVLSPQVLFQNVTATVTVEAGFESSTVRDAVASAVLESINTLGIGDDVIRNEVIATIMTVDGVTNVNLSAPVEDVPIGEDQLARTSLANISIT